MQFLQARYNFDTFLLFRLGLSIISMHKISTACSMIIWECLLSKQPSRER